MQFQPDSVIRVEDYRIFGGLRAQHKMAGYEEMISVLSSNVAGIDRSPAAPRLDQLARHDFSFSQRRSCPSCCSRASAGTWLANDVVARIKP